MIIETLVQLYQRDLERLKIEVGQYNSEDSLWAVSDGVTNSAGNLTLHLIGNLKHFIGAVLGGSGYVRDRDSEFAIKGTKRDGLISAIEETADVVAGTLKKLAADDLSKTYPIEVFGHPMTTEYFLIHLSTHLNYHLGQINYHRRLLGS
jgi:uncharacterized damage-inducible protein DinB